MSRMSCIWGLFWGMIGLSCAGDICGNEHHAAVISSCVRKPCGRNSYENGAHKECYTAAICFSAVGCFVIIQAGIVRYVAKEPVAAQRILG